MLRKVIYLALILATVPFVVFAQDDSSSPAAGLSVSPAIVERSVSPGESGTIDLTLTNRQASEIAVNIDFSSLIPQDELLSDADRARFDASEWFRLVDNGSLIFAPRQSRTVTYEYSVPRQAVSGGNYAFISHQILVNEIDGNPVQTIPVINVPVLLTVSGPIEEELELTQVTAPRFVSSGYTIVSTLSNTGNVHALPRVSVAYGQQSESIESSLVLPGTARDIEFAVDEVPESNWLRWGQQTIEVEVAYGSPQKVASASIDVWVIPAWYALGTYGVVASLLLIFALFRRRLAVAWRVLMSPEGSSVDSLRALSVKSDEEMDAILRELDMRPQRRRKP